MRIPLTPLVKRLADAGAVIAAPYTARPSCLNWPRCACRRRYDPDRATACTACSTEE